jgi:hypothetical protein
MQLSMVAAMRDARETRRKEEEDQYEGTKGKSH